MTVENPILLTSRRSYEFAPDHIRLSLLSTQDVIDRVTQAFHFRASAITQPQATFGPVPSTFPPGLVFNMGVWVSDQGELVPIRMFHFEQRRIVIDVAAASTFIDGIYDVLRGVLTLFNTADGAPAVGEHNAALNYSEITARLSFPAEALLPPPVVSAFRNALALSADAEPSILPVFHALPWRADAEVSGTPTQDSLTLTLSPRAGTHLRDRVYFSSAPLDSSSHLTYLTSLDEALS